MLARLLRQELQMILRRSASIARVFLFGLSFAFIIGCGTGTPPAAPSAQPSAINDGPKLGYFWSATERSLRPILGVAGSSQVGQSIVPAGVYVSGTAAADTGLLLTSDGKLVALHLPAATTIPVTTGIAANATLRLSPSGAAAIAYAANSPSIALITGLPDAPKFQTLSAPPNLIAAAVSDNATVLAASTSGNSVTISLARAAQSSPITTISKLGGLNFIPGSDDALITDSARNTLTLIRNTKSASAPQIITASGLNHPTAIAASRDGRYAVIANSADKNLIRIDLTAATAPATVPCTCQPTRVESLDGNTVFRVTDIGATPGWLIDADPATPRTLFIPAFQAAAGKGGAK
jgi:hypothetical protein